MTNQKLCLLLLLSSYTLAVTSRLKAHKKYVYQYTAESRNGVVGTANLWDGSKVSCQIEIEVPQMSRYIMHTRDCALSEVSAISPQGRPVYRQVPSLEAFRASMEKHPLKFTVEEDGAVQLYPDSDEPVNILNIKRGVISALMVPVMEDEVYSLQMSTLHGKCLTDYQVNARKDIATDVTLSRDLSQCDHFYSRNQENSPLALLQKMHRPISKLITSTQDCNYQFDNKGKHITTAMCTEKHIYSPFSYEDNEISSVVTQHLSFQSSKRTNNRAFDVNHTQGRPLHFEDPDHKTSVQTQDAALSSLRDLVALAGTEQGQKRTSLFHKLVSSLRVLRNETLSQMVPEMLDISGWLTWQALFQCGTLECTSAILQTITTIDGVSLEVDALVYALSLQANPDATLVRDMLSLAQNKQRKAIMYALANTVKKFHKEEVTSLVTDVSKFMETLLNDCVGKVTDQDSDPERIVFLVLRVVGVMGQAMQDVSPSLISSVLQCAKKTDIPLSNQKAAIQAFRMMDINDEIRNVLLEVYQDPQSPGEKRLAAYLILMRNPDQALVRDIVNNLGKMRDKELKSFVVSHLTNIHNSGEPQMHQLGEYIRLALKDQLSPTNKAVDGMSQNYKKDSPLGSVQTNIIFDATSALPKEVMLETTLKIFDNNYDIFEVGVEGTGFEPTIDALFGEKGFFPDSISKVMYWAHDNGQMLREALIGINPDRNRMKRQVPKGLLTDLAESIQKLIDDMGSSPAPEALAYLRLLGDEIGYMKTSEMRNIAETLFMYYHVFLRILPFKAFAALTSSTENEVFAHYIFMENVFSLPTGAGFPLKFALTGVFTLGAKGGLTLSRTKTDLSFMPSAGIEFITQMGVNIPDYVEAGLKMHTDMYHESSFNAKVTINSNQIRLSIPAPKSNTQLFTFSNKILLVSSGQTKVLPSQIVDQTDSTDCHPLISGMKLCTVMHYSNATSMDQAPYYPLIRESRFAVEIQPTGDVTEYTCIMSSETLREGKKGHHKVEHLKLTLKAEGDDSTEATASLKYDHNKNIVTEVVIPHYDIEAAIKLAVTNSDTKGKKMHSVTIDVTNKNIPKLNLVGRTRHDKLKDAMLQLQMVIPSLKTDASFTATLKKDEDVLMELETVIDLPETLYQQKASLKYDDEKFELELNSDLNSEIHKIIPNVEDHRKQLQQLLDHILDQKVAKTDMKLRHIVTKGIEAGNIWLDKLSLRIPYLANLRSKRSISNLTLPALPEKLFLQSDSLFRYQFNKDKMVFSIPLPYGSKTSEELNIPATLSIPLLDLREIGLYIPAKNYPLPSFSIPPSLDITVPLLGLAEAFTKINSNFYSWEGSISGGNNTVDVPSYIAQYKAVAQSPFDLLSYKLEGIGMMSGSADNNLKYLLNSSFSHRLIDTSISVLEMLRVTNKPHARASYKIEASSPVGLQASLYYSAQSTSTLNSDQVSGDGTMDGLLKIGSFYTNTSYTYSYTVRPLEREGRGESILHLNLPFIQVHNMIQGVYANSELNIVSKTNVQEDHLGNLIELKYKDAQLTLKCSTVTSAMGKSLNNILELGLSSQMAILRIESQADDDTSRAYSLVTGSLDSNQLEVNTEGSLIFDTYGRGLHKAYIMVSRNGLTASGTNSIQCNPVTVENTFNGAIDRNGATLTTMTKVMAEEGRGELAIEGKITAAEASLNGNFKGHAYNATTRNNMDLVLNRRGLTFTSNTMGKINQMKTENSHTLTISLWRLAFRSKTDNFVCEDTYYKQDTKVDMKMFVMSFDMTNDLKFYDVSLNNEGHIKLEPFKADLSGSVLGAYGEEHSVKSTYELKYDNMAGIMKYSMSGNAADTQLSHKCEFEFAGLSAKSDCEARLYLDALHFDSTIRTMVLPFTFTVDAVFNSDGEINLGGKHAGQMSSKLLVKVEPLSLAYSQDLRSSTTHILQSKESSTYFDNKFDGLLTPSDQSLTWKVKSKLNNYHFNQDISAYNNPERIGLEFSGTMLTDTFSTFSIVKRSPEENQEFSMAGVLKYEKNNECHIIELPFIRSFPAAFDQLKGTLVQALESLEVFLNNLDIIQQINDFKAKLDQLPKQVSDFMHEMDLEGKIDQVNAKLDYLIGEFSITMDDMETVMNNLRKNLEDTVIDISTKIRDFILTIEEYIKGGHLADRIKNTLLYVENELQAFDKKYKIKQSLVRAFDIIEDIIRQIDIQKLTESSAAWLQELNSKYGILEKIKEKLSEIKGVIKNFDVSIFLQDIKEHLLSVDLAMYVEQLSYKIPTLEIAKVTESMNDVIVNWIDEYEIPNKLNAVYFYIRDLLLKYEIDVKFKELMNQMVILVEEFKIDETVQSMIDTLKSINFEFAYDKIMQFLNNVTSQLREIDFKKSIDELNERCSLILKSMKEFDYNAFVDETNKKIAEITNYINEQIKTYEIVQKIEAIRDFFKEIQSSVYAYLDELKNTKAADVLKKLKNVIDTAFYNDIKMKVNDIFEDIQQRILDMDIRDEMYIYLQKTSESYSNMVAYISAHFDKLIEKIRDVAKNSEIINNIKKAVDKILGVLKRAEIEVPTFVLPFTDLVIPAFTIKLNELHEIHIPAQISVPGFTILGTHKIPAFTINFDEIKANIVSIIDDIRTFEIPIPDPEDIFGDLRVFYLTQLPDFTFSDITLSAIQFPTINIPKLNLRNFVITMLPIPEIKMHEIPSDICIPVFGKLYGEFRVSTPQYSHVAIGKIENSTSTPKNPQFTATITSYAKSPIRPLEYTVEATVKMEAPRMKKLLFVETVNATHTAFSIDHEGSMTLSGTSAEASAKTTIKATTQTYTADLVNNFALRLKSGISAAIDTTYNHNLDIPSIETFSQVSVTQNIAATVESGMLFVTSEMTGNGKWSFQDYSDEGTHKSNIEFNVDFGTSKLTFSGETDCKAFKAKKTLIAESVILSHITVEARCETEAPSVKNSVLILKGQAHTGDLTIALTGSHDAEFTESLVGSMANSLEFMVRPFEMVLDVNNKVNTKIFFPMRLTGKVDLQHDSGIILNSERQSAFWFALARFNQYKYDHIFKVENNKMEIFFHSSTHGEANLDFLTVPLSIPPITVPYLNMMTPEVRDLSLWEHTGLKTFLTTPQQSFDMTLKLHNYKNPDVHCFELHLEPIYSAISDNANIIQAHFEQSRDKVVELLKYSYNQAKRQYVKHKIDTSSLPPRIFTVPRYRIPLLDIEVSSFRAEMPAFGYFVPKEVSTPSFKVPALGVSVPSYTLVLPSLELPVIHVPETLGEIKLPTFTLPDVKNNIAIPAMGNITYDFSIKSTVINLSANAGLYNQSDIVARYGASSTSLFDMLNAKIDGTTSLTRKRGIKLATTVSLEHNNVEASHECAVSLTKRSIEASVANTAKINLSILNLEFNQELTANTKTKQNVASQNKLKYVFNIPLIDSVGKGNFDIKWALEALSSYVSLEVSTQGKSDVTMMGICNFAGDLANEASFYLNANSLRSTVTTTVNSNIDRQEKQKRQSNNNIFLFNIEKSLAFELSLQRVFATVDYRGTNNVDFASVNSFGKHIIKGDVDFVPFRTFMTTLNIDASQPSSLGHAELIQNIILSISSGQQSFTWSTKEQLGSLVHACDLLVSNDVSEMRIDLTESVEGHLAFLKSVKFPVYQKTVWDVLKFDQVTNMDQLQVLNISYSIVYTKTMDGQEYTIPSKLFEDRVTFSIPGISISVPSWIKEIPLSLRNIEMQFEDPNVPEHITLPPSISVPAFKIPFTTLHVEPFTINPKNIIIPRVITTTAFEIRLPTLPVMSVPSFSVETEYLLGKVPFLLFRIKENKIAVSSFTLPKSFAIGKHTISLDEITNQISNFELPTISIPEQNIEIPEIALHLPTSVFIPAFGVVSTTVKVSSPIYNVSTTASLEKRNSSLATSLNSLCTSTLIFLEYDISANASLGFDSGLISLNAKCNLIHNDVNVNWQHVLAQNMRMMCQPPPVDLMESHHTINADITSRTFFDVSFRYASRKDGITASVVSPSSGFLGLHLQQRSKSQLYGKLFSRYLSSPEVDTNVFTLKATLKNPQKLILETAWNLDFFQNMIEGAKNRTPAMTDAMLKFINKYHKAHFGFDLNRGSLKLKNTVSNVIERMYHEVHMSSNTLNAIKLLCDHGKDMYYKASDSLMSMRMKDLMDKLAHEARQILKWSEGRIVALLEAVTQFLSDIKLAVPGSQEKLSCLEILQKAHQKVSRATERAIQRFSRIIEQISRYISEIEFTIHGTDIVVNGNEIMEKLKSSTRSVIDQLKHSVHRGFGLLQKTVDDLIWFITEKGENFLIYLQDENIKVASEVDAIHVEALQSSKHHIEEVQRSVAEIKDLAKLKIEEVYNALDMPHVNNDINELISILQSHLYDGLNESIDVLRRTSQSTAPYIRVNHKKMDIEIPLPFPWKSVSEWLKQCSY